MKQELLYIVTQPEAKNSYWAHLIQNGICEEANERHDTLFSIDFRNLSYDLNSQYVLVVGNNIEWMEAASAALSDRGAFPIIVNACMIPLGGIRYSGVTFELEEMIEHIIDLLAFAGRRHTALLGVNPNSLTDRVKADSFKKLTGDENIIWSRGELEMCVADFVRNFEGDKYDSAICANDTVAIRLINRMLENGYELPSELYIVGMGNSCVGANLRVGLTSVMFDYYEMGRMAVRLYHSLCRMKTPCHMKLSLPCRLVIRHSAPLCEHSRETKLAEIKIPEQSYFDGNEVQNIILVENLLQSADMLDREILFGVSRGESCDHIAERLGFSDRAVRYRLANLVRISGLENRGELEAAIRRAVGEEF